MKKIASLVYLLLSAFILSAQSNETTYAGTINGYHESMGFSTGQLIVNNVVTGQRELHVINIKDNGDFHVNFPLAHKQEAWVSFPFFHSPVYFEPGKNHIQDFRISNTWAVTSIFKGDGAIINNDINKVRSVLDYNWETIEADIYRLTPEQYKAYFLGIKANKLRLIDSIAEVTVMSEAAVELARRNVEHTIASYLIFYNETSESVYRRKNNIPFSTTPVSSPPKKLSISYYDFLNKMTYNDPSAMVSYSYYEFLNRLMHVDLIYDKANEVQDTSKQEIKSLIKFFGDIITLKSLPAGALEKARPEVLTNLLKTDISLELDLMYLQSVSQQIDYGKDTLSDTALDEIGSKIKHKFLLEDVFALNNKNKQSIRDAATKTGYTYNQMPAEVPADSFWIKIVDRYKGKVIFVDFWATWCVPCLQGIQQIAPLKEELADNKNIVFLYITNTSSPEKNYSVTMPGIKGEHYRVSTDQYNILSKIFQISGIPHYAIINKQGAIVNRHFLWKETRQVKQQLIALESE